MSNAISSFQNAGADSHYRDMRWESTKPSVTLPNIEPPSKYVDQERRERFFILTKQWSEDTNYMSSVSDMISHPAYQEIITMGKPAIGLILEKLEREPDFWFEALREITQENPVRDEDAGDLDLMTRAWLEWGTRNQYR